MMTRALARRQALFACSLLIKDQLDQGWDLAPYCGSDTEQQQVEAEVRRIAADLQRRSAGAR